MSWKMHPTREQFSLIRAASITEFHPFSSLRFPCFHWPDPHEDFAMLMLRRLAATAMAAVFLLMGCASHAAETPLPVTRPFHLGFTRWPADLTVDGVLTAQNFAHAHGDIVSVKYPG